MSIATLHTPALNRRNPLIALTALVAVYAPALLDLVKDWWTDANYSHGFLIPLISLYLLRKDRSKLNVALARPASAATGAGAGAALLIAALGLYALGNGAAEYFTVRVSFVLALAGATLYFYGPAVLRAAWFPLAFLFFMIPWPYVIYYAATFPLQLLATKISMVALNAIGVAAVQQGNIIHLSGMSLEVAEACSGVRSMISLLALGALYAYLSQARTTGRLIVFVSTLPIALATNSIRVFFTAVLAYAAEAPVTEEPWHSALGLSVFVMAFVMLFIVSALTTKLLGEKS
ncbi:MAG TPA: exosortase/archaeosortase family protein [candidate division Zixibacteria bacterium]|nr:exosortase/archaeosortase family protein [candidate division Zixibacteria bacterium]